MGLAIASSSISIHSLLRPKYSAYCESQSNEEDYPTLLLRHCYQRIPPNKRIDSLSTFQSVLDSNTPSTQSSDSNMLNFMRHRMGIATEDAFVRSLRPLLRNHSLFDMHRKLASATYRCASTTSANPSLFSASDLANTSAL